MAVGGGRSYNPGWNLATDLPSMLTVSTAVAQGALHRKESRGGHTREDFPSADPELGKVNLVQRQADQRGYDAPITIEARAAAGDAGGAPRAPGGGILMSDAHGAATEPEPEPELEPGGAPGQPGDEPAAEGVPSFAAPLSVAEASEDGVGGDEARTPVAAERYGEPTVAMRVWRGDADGGEFAEYALPAKEGEVVLDVIHRIQATDRAGPGVPVELQGRQVRVVLGRDQRQAPAHVHDPAWTPCPRAR